MKITRYTVVWTQVEKDINTGVLILRTVDLTVCNSMTVKYTLQKKLRIILTDFIQRALYVNYV